MSDQKKTLPVIPLRNTVLFPESVVALSIGRSKSMAIIEDYVLSSDTALSSGSIDPDSSLVAFLAQKSESIEDPTLKDMYQVGTLAKVLKVIQVQDNNFTVIVKGVSRVKLEKMTQSTPYFIGEFTDVEVDRKHDAEEEAIFKNIKDTAIKMASESPDVPKETAQVMEEIKDPSQFCDFLAANIDLDVKERQQILETTGLKARMKALLAGLSKQQQVAKLADEIRENILKETDRNQKEYYLRQQLKAIKKELGDGEDDLDELEYRIEISDLPEEVEAAAKKQLNRLRTMQPSSSEYSVTLNYIETILDIPWNVSSEDTLDLNQAQEVLDTDHYGLDKVKNRLIEYLAVRSLKDDMKGPILCLAGPPGVGKAQPLYSKIMTPDGWTTMGEIQPGDEVIGSDGSPHKVLEVFPQGKKDIYRVYFSDGTFSDCCKEHLWETQTDLDRKAKRRGSVKSLEEIMESLRYGADQRKNHSIPMTAPVAFSEKELPISPYVLGALLGNGTLYSSGAVKFSSENLEVVDRLEKELPEDVGLYKESGDNVDYRITTGGRPFTDKNEHLTKNDFQKALIELGLAGQKSDTKFVPNAYLHGSIGQRLDLLHGLMDTDGTVHPNRVTVQFSSTSRNLIDAVIFIVQSLGGTASESSREVRYKDESCKIIQCKTCYTLVVSLPADIKPFWCQQKGQKYIPKTKYRPKRFIDKVEYVGAKEAKCILVEAEDHLYLTDNFIVTHNTSLGKSIARALGRKFVRISLGGVHDESEIRGHRRTYVGAMPGRLAKALIKAKTNNPVIMLDEIDKVGKDFRGDPQAAMLEVLDPEQNHTFSDHYVEVPLNLSNVLFIATANQLETISAPLRDRMEIIEVPSYTSFEKRQIAQEHLIPKQLEAHGISEQNLQLTDEAIATLIDSYTREAGVRNLERRIADVCRSVAVKVAKTEPSLRTEVTCTIKDENLSEILGPERYRSEVAQRVAIPGVSTGLAWTQSGGDILFIEASRTQGEGKIKLTGQLGDVMKESAEAAISYLRANATSFGLTLDSIKRSDLHIHFPAGSIPKDGPSAGITIFTAVLSILTGINVRNDVAMTGEITLRGSVLPVGGIKEKVTAAHRAGIKHIILPKMCEKDLVDVSDDIKKDVHFHLVERVDEIPSIALTESLPEVPLEVLS
jgi:ATP-dependent Lon protease